MPTLRRLCVKQLQGAVLLQNSGIPDEMATQPPPKSVFTARTLQGVVYSNRSQSVSLDPDLCPRCGQRIRPEMVKMTALGFFGSPGSLSRLSRRSDINDWQKKVQVNEGTVWICSSNSASLAGHIPRACLGSASRHEPIQEDAVTSGRNRLPMPGSRGFFGFPPIELMGHEIAFDRHCG